MATLTALKFRTAGGGDRAPATFDNLQKQQPVQVHGAPAVTWPARSRTC